MTSLGSLHPDKRNANKGTAKGQKQIVGSIQRNGFGRSGLIDLHGNIIAGNKTAEAAAEVFGVDVEPIIVETDGRRPVYVKRTDLDLTDPDPNNPARRLAYEDNLSSHFSFQLDPAQVMADIEAGFNFEAIDITLPDLGEMLDKATAELLRGGESNLIGTPLSIPEQFIILIELQTESEQKEALEHLTEIGYKCKALIS
jgi:hypothetical protein